MTFVYLMRHSQALKSKDINNDDSLQMQNEKWPLSVEGENIARKKSFNYEFINFDVVFSSNYVRAISTAKYFADDIVNIDESFDERKFGIDSWDDLPDNFEEMQFNDFDYKMKKGESLNEVIEREYRSLENILKHYKNRKILIVGHSTAFASLLSKWCDINYSGPYIFNQKVIFDGKWNYCETFKLTFDDDNCLIDIENIK